MSNYFLSFSSTFESVLNRRVTAAELASGTMVFACRADHVLMPFEHVPVEVTFHNKIKPQPREKTSTVSRSKVDPAVLIIWDMFAAEVKKAKAEGRLLFLRDIGHPSYRRFSREALRRGDQVFWRGAWVTPEEVAANRSGGSVAGASTDESGTFHPRTGP